MTEYVQWVDIGIQTKLVRMELKHENMFAQRNRDTTVHIYKFCNTNTNINTNTIQKLVCTITIPGVIVSKRVDLNVNNI